jgi:hypothetical protein
MKQKKKYLRTWVVSVYNVYNHKNAFYIYKQQQNSQGGFRYSFTEYALFTIIPSVSYQFKF